MTIVATVLLVLAALPTLVRAQVETGTIRGQVMDPSGRVVPKATIQISQGRRTVQTTRTDIEGRYQVSGLAPGAYTIRASASGFAPYLGEKYEVGPRAVKVLDIPLALAVQSERMTVSELAKVDLNPENNAGATILRGKDLDSLSDDRDDLAVDLQALAGPAAGPNGGQIYIDGFTGGRLPPKSTIREIRVNANPFSAQFDRPGNGRIEIFTKPGAQDFHGEFQFVYGNDVFNARNPFVAVKPAYERRQWEGEVTGPLTKKTSFLADFEIRRTSDNVFVKALTLDPALQTVEVAQGIVTPLSGTEANLKVDHQISKSHTLAARYMHQGDARDSRGVGGFSLATRAYRNEDTENGLQASETAVIGAHAVNEIRGRFLRQRTTLQGKAFDPTITVLDAFTGGGPPLRLSFTNQDRYEVQNITSLMRGAHLARWGARLRVTNLKDQDTQNYTGTYTFSSLDSYRLTLLGLRNGLSAEQIRASGGGASQFSIAAGNPLAALTQMDLGFFVQDDWRVRQNFTISAGIRYEVQNHISDHRDWAPRMGFAYGIGSKSKAFRTVIRGGAGLFYDRFGEGLTLDALRRDGIHQQQFVVQSPDFYPLIPSTADLASTQLPQTIRRVDSGLSAPRALQTTIGIERQLPKNILIATNYVHTGGLHQLRSRNINAPVAGVLPYGGTTAIYLYEASGRFQQNQLITTITARVSSKFSLTASYTLNKAHSDTDGAGTFPSDTYNLRPEYSRAAFDIRHRVQLNGSMTAPWGLRFSPLLTAITGRPYDITLGRDVNGDSLFTDRPGLATDPARPTVIQTPYGLLDLAPQPGQAVLARNSGSGPAQVFFNLRLSKTIKIGQEPDDAKATGKKGGRDPFELTFSASARNMLNHPNLSQPVGNLSSPLFGQSTGLAAGAAGSRRIDLQMRFNF